MQILDSTTFITTKKSINQVEIGDAKQEVFYPQAKIKSWDNEANFSVRFDEDIKDSSFIIVDNVVEWTKDDKKIRLYEVDIPEAEEGGFEFEITLDAKPKSDILNFTIETKLFSFHYQPELTEEEIEDGSERPENIVGSYAVYHTSKRDNKYKTGKAFHIYRPWVEDDKGERVWCDLDINEGNKLLTITMPQKFLDTAVYPIVVDPTFGHTGIGATQYAFSGNGYDGGKYTLSALGAGETADVSSVTGYVYTTSSTSNIKGCLHNDNSPTYSLIAVAGPEAVDTTQTWITSSFSPEENITNGNYCLGMVTEGWSTQCRYDSVAGQTGLRDFSNSYADPQPLTDVFILGGRKMSFYATYTIPVSDTPPKLNTKKMYVCYDDTPLTDTINIYNTISGVDCGMSNYMCVSSSGTSVEYVQISTDTGHDDASHLRVYDGTTTYAVLKTFDKDD